MTGNFQSWVKIPDPVNPNRVNLSGLGGPDGDAAQFGIMEIPMIFANETASPGESYDLFFSVHAPDTIGTCTPQYQINSSSSMSGEVTCAPVNVIENLFHPVVQPDGLNCTPTWEQSGKNTLRQRRRIFPIQCP